MYSVTYVYFLSVVCSNINSFLHRFRDITVFTLYMTSCKCGNISESVQDRVNVATDH